MNGNNYVHGKLSINALRILSMQACYGPTTYVTGAGDTACGLVIRFNVTSRQLALANPQTSFTPLTPGLQVLPGTQEC